MNDYNWYYVIASKGIQDFIFKGNKLKAAIGASQLIEMLPCDLVGRVLDKLHSGKEELLEGRDYRWLSETAGGARLLIRDKKIVDELCAVMPLAVSFYAPGLNFVQAAVELKDMSLKAAMHKADAEILPVRRMMLTPTFPPASPMTARSQRTGLPAVEAVRQADNKEKKDFICAAIKKKNENADKGRDRLANKLEIIPDMLTDDLSKIAGDTSGRIAVVHIDGNGLGAIVREFFAKMGSDMPQSETAEKYSEFCKTIQEASIKSLQEALDPLRIQAEEEGEKCYPFRPIICAGDDVTVIIRNYDAVDFADRFICAFEKNTQEMFAGKEALRELITPDEAMLTACAGIVFTNDKFPFYQAYDLCESLCKYAKDKTHRECSAVAFWRMTTSRMGDADEIISNELTAENDGTVLTMMPYITGSKTCTKQKRLKQLTEFKEALQKLPRGSARQLVNDIYTGKAYVEAAYERMLKVAELKKLNATESKRKELDAAKKNLEKTLAALTGGKLFEENKTPLYDAIQLISEEHSGK